MFTNSSKSISMLVLFFATTLLILASTWGASTPATIFIKKAHAKDFSPISELEFEDCPTVLEIFNPRENAEIFDMAFLDGVCRNALLVIRMQISGNFQGIGEGFFEKLLRLEHFQANDMKNLKELTVLTTNLKHLDLSRNHLEKVDIEFMDELVHLNLSNNFLEVQNIYMSTISQPLNLQLRILDMSFNKLTRIDFFLPFWNLRNLFLNDNKIEHIKPGMLQKYPNLLILNLSKNKIHNLENGVFIGLTQLVNLDLSHNNLKDINIETINTLKSLEDLNLEGNAIENFNQTALLHDIEILKVNITGTETRSGKGNNYSGSVLK